MTIKEFLDKERGHAYSERFITDEEERKRFRLITDLMNNIPKEPPHHQGDFLYGESDGEGYVVLYKCRRTENGKEMAYCYCDLNIYRGEFCGNAKECVYQEVVFRQATPEEKKLLKAAMRKNNFEMPTIKKKL